MGDEEDGNHSAVKMLMDHLANVKLAAEETEFRLRERVKVLESSLKSFEEAQHSYEDELEMSRSIIHELKIQQSKKWRLEALDDWKALVNQLNADRSRLQVEVDTLKGENDRLSAEVRKLRGALSMAAPDGAGQQLEEEGAEGGGGGGSASPSSSPTRVVVDELRSELASVRRHLSLLEVQKRETEIELGKLKREVRDALDNGHGMLGGYLLQSVLGFLSGGAKKKERYRKPSYTPVLSV